MEKDDGGVFGPISQDVFDDFVRAIDTAMRRKLGWPDKPDTSDQGRPHGESRMLAALGLAKLVGVDGVRVCNAGENGSIEADAIVTNLASDLRNN